MRWGSTGPSRMSAPRRGVLPICSPMRLPGHISFAAGDATALPLGDGTVDVVIASEILEHIPNYLTVLEEARRVLRPGGRLCISVPRQWPEWVCWKLSEGYRSTPGGPYPYF